ncbi:hypothetical protein R4J09_10980 [Brachyspira intermedia]|uniref:HAD family hydrolase n=1 Tax=Brachyspira intermedia TaxID=84377 RepID=UPI0030054DB2
MNTDKHIQLYSFDIFDTLITRSTATPEGIFAIMQYKLLEKSNNISSFIKNNFYNLRISAEQQARKLNPEKEEITIYDIYSIIACNNSIYDEQIYELINLEFKTELENSIPIEENINKLKALYDSGHTVILISDMYLPQKIISEILLKHDNIFKNIKLYISSEYNKTKSSGNLFKIIKDIENIEYNNWFHIGDNINSDVKQPNMLSINATLYNYVKLYDFELEIIKCYKNNINVQNIIGMSKNFRLNNNDNEYNLEITIGSIVLFFYVAWIIDNAITKNINELYFISRDGFILKNIADIIINYRNINNINTHYIYGSRYAWQFANISKIENIPDYLFTDKINTLRDLKYFFNKDLDNILKLLPKKYKNIKRLLSIKEKYKLKNFIENNEVLMELIIENSNTYRKTLIEYLNQEINFNTNFAFVDSRGTGKTIECISEILEYKKKLKVFYMSTVLDNYGSIVDKIFYMDNYDYNNGFIEFFTRAMHGEVIGYKYECGKILPIFEESEEELMNKINYKKYLDGVITFIKNYLLISNIENKEIIFIKNFYNKYIENMNNNALYRFMVSVPNSIHPNEKYTTIKNILYLLDIYDYKKIDFSNKHIMKLVNFKKKYGNIFQFILKIHFKKYDSYIIIFGIKIRFGFN